MAKVTEDNTLECDLASHRNNNDAPASRRSEAMAIDISKLNETQLTALMGKIQARLSELQLEKMARVRDKVIAMITSEGLDYAELMDHPQPICSSSRSQPVSRNT